MTADSTIHPDLSISGNNVQMEKGRWNMVKKEVEAQGKWKIRGDISVSFKYLNHQAHDLKALKKSCRGNHKTTITIFWDITKSIGPTKLEMNKCPAFLRKEGWRIIC